MSIERGQNLACFFAMFHHIFFRKVRKILVVRSNPEGPHFAHVLEVNSKLVGI